MGFNRCPFQLLRSYKDTKRTRMRLNRNVAPCGRPTSNVTGPLHECKKVCPCTKALPHSGIRAWIKQGRRKKKKRGRQERQRPGGWWREREPSKKKTYLNNPKKAYLVTAKVNKAAKQGEEPKSNDRHQQVQSSVA